MKADSTDITSNTPKVCDNLDNKILFDLTKWNFGYASRPPHFAGSLIVGNDYRFIDAFIIENGRIAFAKGFYNPDDSVVYEQKIPILDIVLYFQQQNL
jgi:hypothetical protein